jgi:hypothetical protein
MDTDKADSALFEERLSEKCPTFSEAASFSSSLKGLFVVQRFLVAEFPVVLRMARSLSHRRAAGK